MKCPIVKGNGKCGNETGKPIPPQWINHTQFDPVVLRIFFQDVPGITEQDIQDLDNFVCSDCWPKWEAGNNRSNAVRAGIRRRKAKVSYDPTI